MSVAHTPEQGQRVHYLTNLGGLVAIAGLERLEPDLLLGILLEVAERLPRLEPARVAKLRDRGVERLAERAAEKRAWRARQRSLDLHRVDLTTEQLRTVIRSLGAQAPAARAALVPTLSRILRARDR